MFVARYPASTLYSGGTGAYVVGEDANSIWRFQYAGIVNNQPTVMGDKGTTYDFGAFTPGDGRDYMVNPGTTVAPYTLGFMNAFDIYDFSLSLVMYSSVWALIIRLPGRRGYCRTTNFLK